ncbi:GPR1/FUN34/YaaH family transporter [Amycolatopsis sp. FDAARGOS 1241]|uniref:GPR1/FUN34/YaaH family transporter n=1 Tax=Amycolatopsis sp. FDAARGOS 1241 TaxID=2778070 RepID=UPI00195104D3|nr:GPR1/FUN34/YaaH family transporter [Amycolatopsis sp. FDAARGOS 1241]QRP42777.1 hypothetical protein I6J71_25200 [Amycolatopsis sp. FDAARGOS 1241]
MPLALAGFGFSLTILSLANTGVVDQRTAMMFVPVAMGTGALATLVGGIWEFRGNTCSVRRSLRRMPASCSPRR